jgi:CheY-like chemotaxis protein
VKTVEALRDLGYGVVEAANGDAALALLGGLARVDLLFTDIVMPGMNGRELADRVCAARPGTPVLYTTGYTRNAVVHNGMLDPGVAFLAKPFTIDQLARKVADAIVVSRAPSESGAR